MALCQFVQHPDIRITRRMFTPQRKLQDPMTWYKVARKAIPQIPLLCTGTYDVTDQCPHWHSKPEDHWHLSHEPEISVRYLKFTMTNEVGERCHLVIDRTVNGM
jgi:hypothetical protein